MKLYCIVLALSLLLAACSKKENPAPSGPVLDSIEAAAQNSCPAPLDWNTMSENVDADDTLASAFFSSSRDGEYVLEKIEVYSLMRDTEKDKFLVMHARGLRTMDYATNGTNSYQASTLCSAGSKDAYNGHSSAAMATRLKAQDSTKLDSELKLEVRNTAFNGTTTADISYSNTSGHFVPTNESERQQRRSEQNEVRRDGVLPRSSAISIDNGFQVAIGFEKTEAKLVIRNTIVSTYRFVLRDELERLKQQKRAQLRSQLSELEVAKLDALEREATRLQGLSRYAFLGEASAFAQESRGFTYESDRHGFAEDMQRAGASSFALYKYLYSFAKDLRGLQYDSDRDSFVRASLDKAPELLIRLETVYVFAKDIRQMSYDSDRLSAANAMLEKPAGFWQRYADAYIYARDTRRMTHDSDRDRFAMSAAEENN